MARSLTALLLGLIVLSCAPGARATAESDPEPTDAEEQFQLGRRLAWGLEETKQDEREGFKWLLKAAEQGHLRAQTQVAMAYQQGRGVAPNILESVKWMRKAAEQGHPKAQFELGIYYRDGKGVPKDRVLGLMWLLLSQEKGGLAGRVAAPGLARRLEPRDRKEAWELFYQWREAHGLPRVPPRANRARTKAKPEGRPAPEPRKPAVSETEPKPQEDAMPAEAPPGEVDTPPST